jgi:hypothetical protein
MYYTVYSLVTYLAVAQSNKAYRYIYIATALKNIRKH